MPGWLALALSIALNAAAQVMVKVGANRLADLQAEGVPGKVFAVATQAPQVIIGLGLYGFSFVFWTITLSKYDLSFVYPIIALGYVVVLAASWLILREQVTVLRVVGTLIICTGVAVVART